MTLSHIVLGVVAYVAIAVVFTRLRVLLINMQKPWTTWTWLAFVDYESRHDQKAGRSNAPVWGAIWPVTLLLEALGLVISLITVACMVISVAAFVFVELIKWLARLQETPNQTARGR